MKSKEEILVDEIIERLKTRPDDFKVEKGTISVPFIVVSKNGKVRISENGQIFRPIGIYTPNIKRLEELVNLITPIIQSFKDEYEKEEKQELEAILKNLWD